MLDHVFLLLYIVTVGVTFSCVALSLVHWLRVRTKSRFNTFVFVAYLALLLLLAGIRFYWEGLLGGNRSVAYGMGVAELLGYAMLLYYLPATVNHVLERKWTPLRLGASVVAVVVYFSLGTTHLFLGSILPIFFAAGFIFFIALAVILLDAAKSIPKIRKTPTRVTVTVVGLLTLVFLPLVMIGKMITEIEGLFAVTPDLRFLFLSLYYFWMAIAGNIFYVRELAVPEIRSEGIVVPQDLPLTDREAEIAGSLAKGLTYGEIAEDLDISPHTVRNHVSNVYKKLSVRSKLELIAVLRGERTL